MNGGEGLDYFKELFYWFIALLYPRAIVCMYCKAELSDINEYSLCSACIDGLEFVSAIERPSCCKCGKSLGFYYGLDICVNCSNSLHYFDKGFVVLNYNDISRQLLFSYKYNNKRFIGIHLGEMLYDKLSVEGILETIDYVCAVPVHKKRLKERGFNQAALLAETLVKLACSNYQLGYCDLLVRDVHTESQNKIGREKRKDNVQNAFSLKNGYKTSIYGKNILIVDDIYTTGATMNACAKVLKLNGAKQVFMAAIAAGEN